jgi:hypothetical protein
MAGQPKFVAPFAQITTLQTRYKQRHKMVPSKCLGKSGVSKNKRWHLTARAVRQNRL